MVAMPEPADFDWEAALAAFVQHPLPAVAADETPAVQDVDWRAALLAEAETGDGLADDPLLPKHHEPRVRQALARDPVLRRWTVGQPLANRGEHRALLRLYYGPHERRLLEAIRRDPFYRRVRDAWQPGIQAERRNLALFYDMYDHLSATMGRIYRFAPAPIGQSAEVPHWAAGMYFPDEERIRVSSRMLLQSAADLLSIIAHEQTHRFQHVQQRRRRQGLLMPLEGCLAAFWEQEEAQRPPGLGLHLGTEHHAYLLGLEVRRVIITL